MAPSADLVRRAVRGRTYRLTEHAEREREVDSISVRQLEEALGSDTLEMLEDYPDDPRGPSGLYLGFAGGDPIHAVIAISDPVVVVVTVYRPDSRLWYDWRRRV